MLVHPDNQEGIDLLTRDAREILPSRGVFLTGQSSEETGRNNLYGGRLSDEQIRHIYDGLQFIACNASLEHPRRRHTPQTAEAATEWGRNVLSVLQSRVVIGRDNGRLPHQSGLVMSEIDFTRVLLGSDQSDPLILPGSITLLNRDDRPVGVAVATILGNGVVYGFPLSNPHPDEVNSATLIPDSFYNVSIDSRHTTALERGEHTALPVSYPDVDGPWERFSGFGIPADVRQIVIGTEAAELSPAGIRQIALDNYRHSN